MHLFSNYLLPIQYYSSAKTSDDEFLKQRYTQRKTLSPRLLLLCFRPSSSSSSSELLSPPQLPLSASQDAMRETAERIRELERALRESMNTSAHREALWAQEEGARVQAQRQVYLMFHTLIEDWRPAYT